DSGRGRRPRDRRIMGRARLLPRSSFGPAPVELRGRAADVPAGSTARDLRVACGGALDRPSRVRPADRALAGKRKPALGTSGRLRWADQVHPHDDRNLDLNCPPMLLSVTAADRRRDLVIVGGKDGLRAWDRTSRRRLWRVELTPALPAGGKEALPSTGPEAGPTAAAEGLVFFASNNHADKTCLVAGIEAATGEIRWLHSLPAFQFGPLSVAG